MDAIELVLGLPDTQFITDKLCIHGFPWFSKAGLVGFRVVLKKGIYKKRGQLYHLR